MRDRLLLPPRLLSIALLPLAAWAACGGDVVVDAATTAGTGASTTTGLGGSSTTGAGGTGSGGDAGAACDPNVMLPVTKVCFTSTSCPQVDDPQARLQILAAAGLCDQGTEPCCSMQILDHIVCGPLFEGTSCCYPVVIAERFCI